MNLKTALSIDFVVTGTVALLQIIAGGYLSTLLGISSLVLQSTGVFLLLFIGLIIYALFNRDRSPSLIKGIIALNILWGIDCLVFLIFMKSELTGLGVAFILVQVIAVFVFAELQYVTAKSRWQSKGIV